jgi:hypothetical protein
MPECSRMQRLSTVRLGRLLPLGVSLVLFAAVAHADERTAPRIDFNRDIRPILSDTCYQCHGPDQAKRKAELRLDTEDGARADLGGRSALVPSDLGQSELYQRIVADDPAERMPPPDSGKTLTARQIGLIRRWIEEGGAWQKHWSFIPPVRSAPPAVKNDHWVRNPVDAFVVARLEREGLSPSPEADRVTLLRRASFDLTGLPPAPAEVDAFLADQSPGAYETAVDRLLASPRFGERMAVRWLDGARYADTNGYQSDGERFMWRWRDWVIDAYNRNMPFDQFTIEQLAGDMLPGATLDQQIASGFNRNHRGNAEGGIVPEEYAVEYVVDRVETTFTVWMGLTMGCGRCHDHKFDPLTQRDFYQAFAYFNNVPEFGRAVKYGNSPPMIRAPTAAQQQALKALDARLRSVREALAESEPAIAAAQQTWEETLDPRSVADWSLREGLRLHFSLDATPQPSDLPEAPAAKFEGGTATFASGRIGQAADFDGTRFIDAGDLANIGFYDKFTFAAWIYPRGSHGGTIFSRMTDVAEGDGYALVLDEGRLQLNLVKRWLDDSLRVETEHSLAPDTWHHVLVTCDGSRQASGITLYVDGHAEPKRILLDLLNQPFAAKEPLRIGGGNGPQGRFHGLVDDVRIYDRILTDAEVQIAAVSEPVGELVNDSRNRPGTPEWTKVRRCFLERGAPDALRKGFANLTGFERERERLVDSFPTTMVMQEVPGLRETFVLIRGEYTKPGEKVTAAIPQCLPSLPEGSPNNRLGFARWLVSPGHPLTARVAVNRCWQMLFGVGLVKTVDDFGAQGEWPSHPELLDWLAMEFAAPSLGESEPQRRGKRLGRQTHFAAAGDLGHLSSIVAGDTGVTAPRSGESTAGSRSAGTTFGRNGSRSGAICRRSACRKTWRSVGQAVSTGGALEGARRHGLCPGYGGGALPPEHVHVLEADRCSTDDDHVRRRGPGNVYRPRDPHEHAAPGADPHERRHIRGGFTCARGTDPARRRPGSGRASGVRLSPGPFPAAETCRTANPACRMDRPARSLCQRSSRGRKAVAPGRIAARRTLECGRAGGLRDAGRGDSESG